MHINPHEPSSMQPLELRQSPAQAARVAIADRPDLAEQPFGQLVSLIARGEAIPAAPMPVVDDTSSNATT